MEEDKEPIFLKDLGMQYPTENCKHKYRCGLYKCGYCGKEFIYVIRDINRGGTKNCGCLQPIKKHGLAKHKFYHTWHSMLKRCYNKTCKAFKDYGERGILVCEDWQDIKTFITWAESTYIEGMSLDRIDNDKGYSPDNCRWANKSTQTINQRIKKNNKSGYVGVNWYKRDKKWFANITFNRELISLGYFKTIEEAVEARDNYIISNNLPHKLSSEYKQNNEPI